MKKIVPDPPHVLHTLPGLSRDEAMSHALEYLDKALVNAQLLADLPVVGDQQKLKDALIDMRISKAMMTVAVAASTLSVAI